MRKSHLLVGFLIVTLQASMCLAEGPLKVGEDILQVFETAHPYRGVERLSAAKVRTFEITFPGATYIAPHFSRFDLAAGDFVVVRSPDGARTWKYEGQGKAGLGTDPDGFWGVHIPGDTALVELHSRHAEGAYGFRIDRFARGYTNAEMGFSDTESVCGTDEVEEARCQFGTTRYARARAVARLLINGPGLCTGWLLGSDGHLVTNQHCIGSASDAQNTIFEFLAEGADCNTNCKFQLACPGTVEATTSTFIQNDFNLDYALVKLPSRLASTYGFLQMRPTGARLEERIYIPQHPSGWGKQIAVRSTHPQNPSGFAEVDGLNENVCQGGSHDEVGYYADTQGGSSGSPVLGEADHCVVGLHHCRGSNTCTANGGDPNRAVPNPEIIADMGDNLPPDALCDCEMALGVTPRELRPGDALTWKVGVLHRREGRVDAAFRMWVEDAAGNVLFARDTVPQTFRYLDQVRRQGRITIPATVAPGDYTLVVELGEMLQGTMEKRKSFTVID